METLALSALKSIGRNVFAGKTQVEPKFVAQGEIAMYNFSDGKYNLTHPRHGGYEGATKAINLDYCA